MQGVGECRPETEGLASHLQGNPGLDGPGFPDSTPGSPQALHRSWDWGGDRNTGSTGAILQFLPQPHGMLPGRQDLCVAGELSKLGEAL